MFVCRECDECCVFCLNCEVWGCMCSFMCFVLEMYVCVLCAVAILSAVFCVICSLLMFVSDASGDHMVETYSSMGLVMALYVAMIVSFCCCDLHVFVLYVSLGSRVSPSILGLMFMGSVILSICSSSRVLYSAGYGVKKVHVVLSGLRMRLFVWVHVCISCRYDWMFAFAMFMSVCVDFMVMSVLLVPVVMECQMCIC